MKILFILMPITAVWLLSANEQGLIGTWAVWTSFIIAIGFVVAQIVAGKARRR